MANKYWVGGTGNWDTSSTKWATTDGGASTQTFATGDTVFITSKNAPNWTSLAALSSGAIRSPTTGNGYYYEVTTSGTTGATEPTWPTPAGTTVTDGTVVWTCRLATITLSANVSALTLTMTGFAGTLAFGTNTISVSGTGTVFTGATTYSVSGTPLILLTNTGSPTKTIIAGNVSEAQSISFEITAGTGTVSFSGNIRSLVFSGSTSTLSGTNAFTLYGDLTFISGITIAVGTSVRTFAGSGTQKITVPSPLNLNFPITFSGTGTYQLQGNVAVGTSSSRTITHTSGTIDLQSYTLDHFGIYTSSSSVSSRGFTGTGVYNITRTGTATYWDCAVATGFTRSGTASVQFTGVNTSANTLTVLHGTTTGAEANAMSFFFGSAPTVVLASGASGNWIADLGVLPSSSITLSGGATGRTIYGGFFGGSTTTQSANPFGVLTFASTSATARNINISSSSYALTFTGVGGSWQLSGAVSTTATFTLTNGTFSTNGFNLSVGTFNFNNSNTKTLTINSTLTVNGGQFIGSATGTTTNFSGFTLTGSSYTVNTPNITIPTVTTLNTVIIGSASSTQTITNLTTTTTCAVYLYGTSTLNVTNLSLYGDGGGNGNLTTYSSGTAELRKAGGTVITSYQTISNIIATGGATWRAPTNAPYNNVDGGGNTGWNFSAISAGGGGNFLMFF
jgi:hypothetical protein